MKTLLDDGSAAVGDDRPAGGHPRVLPRRVPAPLRPVDRGGVVGLGHLRRPGRESLQRVPTLEPLRGTRAHVGDLLDRCPDAAALIDAARRSALIRPRLAKQHASRRRDSGR